MRVLLVRHGATEWSESGQHTSHTDLPLLESGRRRAQQLGSYLRGGEWEMVLSSPLRRARETCELAGLGHEMATDDDLREWDYGEYEGLTTPQIRERKPDWDLWTQGCPGGETPEAVSTRADHVLATIQKSDGDCVLFGHGHILRVIAARWVEQPVSFAARMALFTGTLSTLAFERETRVIREWNREP